MSTIHQCRKKLGLSQKALAEYCHVDQTAVSKWELGKSYPDVAVAMKLSSYFGVPLDSIYENPISFGLISFPVYRHLHPEQLSDQREVADEYFEISAGRLREYFTREELVSGKINRENMQEYFFALQVTEKAMEMRFYEGDTVLIKKQTHVNDDQIAAVCIDSGEARLFQVKWHKKGIVLHSLNASTEPLFYTKSECDAGNIVILGLAAELHGKIS